MYRKGRDREKEENERFAWQRVNVICIIGRNTGIVQQRKNLSFFQSSLLQNSLGLYREVN